jgi:uncharacterized protein with PQ loop repeat
MEHIIDLFVSVVGIATSFSYYPQAWHMYRMRSAEAVSPLSFVILAFGTTTWTVYGLYLRNWVIVSGFVFGMIGSWLVLGLIWRYRRDSDSTQG